jgi:hypothetical protein
MPCQLARALLPTVCLALAGCTITTIQHAPPEEAEKRYIVFIDPQAAEAARERDDGFSAQAARMALGHVDLSSCRAAGAPTGRGHAEVTFNPDGRASKVVVDTPRALPEPALKCIGERLGAVTVAEYDGSVVTVGTAWSVP